MLHDPNRWQHEGHQPFFAGTLFIAALISAALLAVSLGLWADGVVPRQTIGLIALVVTPTFVFLMLAWPMRWRGYRWRHIWLTFAAFAAIGAMAAYGGYQDSLDRAFRLFVP